MTRKNGIYDLFSLTYGLLSQQNISKILDYVPLEKCFVSINFLFLKLFGLCYHWTFYFLTLLSPIFEDDRRRAVEVVGESTKIDLKVRNVPIEILKANSNLDKSAVKKNE